MVIMEVNLPTGFVIEKDILSKVLIMERVKMIETKNMDTIAVIYFEQMIIEDEICVDIDGFLTHTVNERKFAYVSVYDYYDSCECFILTNLNS